jgi:hypothetical protein
VGDPLLVAAVRTAKRTPVYRAKRNVLACVSPSELWYDEDDRLIFVLFGVKSSSEDFLGFAIDSTTQEVVQTAMLSLSLSGSQWRAQNRSPT